MLSSVEMSLTRVMCFKFFKKLNITKTAVKERDKRIYISAEYFFENSYLKYIFNILIRVLLYY